MKVILNVEIVKIPLVAGRVLTDWVFIISNGTSQVGRQDVAIPTAEFELLDGNYTATAQRFDSGGNAFGAQVSASFTVTTPAAAVDQVVTTDPVEAAAVETGDAAGSMTVTMS